MKPYTPSRERVWNEWVHYKRGLKMRADRVARGLPERSNIPPNSEPWLDYAPRTLEDALKISDLVRENILKWCGPSHPSLQP